MAESSLQIQESRRDAVCVVSLTGRIDSSNAEQLTTRLNSLLSSGASGILIDMKQVIYLTSAAFRVLLLATDEAERRDVRFMLCGVLGQVRELFEMGGLLDAFPIRANSDEAIRELNS